MKLQSTVYSLQSTVYSLQSTVVIFAVVLAVAFSSSAHAQLLDFNFSFSNVTGNTDGTVTGEIIGLNSSGTSTPTDVIITSVPLAFYSVDNSSVPIDFGSTGSFTVSGDSITAASVDAYTTPGYLAEDGLALNSTGSSLFFAQEFDRDTVFNNGGLPGANYTYAGIDDAPEPSEYALLLLGAAGLFAGRRFFRSRHSV